MKFYAIFAALSAVLPSPADATNALRRRAQDDVESTADADISSFFDGLDGMPGVMGGMALAGMGGESNVQSIPSKGGESNVQSKPPPKSQSKPPPKSSNLFKSSKSAKCPPLSAYPQCGETGDSVSGDGVCGVNGNSKTFEADQSDTVGACDGSLSGPFPFPGVPGGFVDTKTTLVGSDNALLYQVSSQGMLIQSQLTTLSGNDRRTRTAQSFNPFNPSSPSVPTNASFYRERKVTKEEFYQELTKWLEEYNILDSDMCADPSTNESGYDVCVAHLEESFDL
ncbi:hypothetical protein THAOC_13545 [Thalassiosira oceanica]|uniref:Uncharacterized protein n=1 Tax=Thalassiosira oceanica TaxID=159749 RepID=K0SKV1_THAOC|nr:hypothetical protein THAOC_13545 [Thalassiosira oceanica]|eukprot:EJK65579.1 hypothetical protein THAOC_13545 [Thalassiosira oceanica]